jgi:hypothetical protein
VLLSIRTPNHIIPKYLSGGRTLDWWSRHPADPPSLSERVLRAVMPKDFADWIGTRMLEKAVGRPEQYGLPRPTHRLIESHPTISSEIHYRLGAGDVMPKDNLREKRGRQVAFADGSVEDVDVIIYATGYRISFPFLDQSVISAQNNDIALYYRILDPRYPSLLFLALVQPLCAMMPIAEQQAIFMARYLRGEYHPPEREVMEREMRRAHEEIKAGYVASKRHTIQIQCQEYTDELRAELKRGARRAARAGYILPVPAALSSEPSARQSDAEAEQAPLTAEM